MRVHPDALLEGAVDDLAQRRVRVRREGEVSHSGTGCFGVRALLDEVRRVQPCVERTRSRRGRGSHATASTTSRRHCGIASTPSTRP